MLKYAIRKLFLALPVLLGITLICYGFVSIAGNPVDMMTGPKVTEEVKALRAAQWGLDQPFLVQYAGWLGEVLHGNLGYSYKSYQPVSEMIASHIGPTLLLTGCALLLGLCIALPLGIYSAIHRYQKRDYITVGMSFLGSSIPGFFLAMLLTYLLNVRLQWLPSNGMTTPNTGGDALDILRHLIMPCLVLSVSIVGLNIRYIRSAMLEILETDYMRTATGKGLGKKLVFGRHAFRAALAPIVTVIGMQIAPLFSGAVIVEKIFSWPGLGLITMNAVTQRDYPVIMGVCLLSAVVVLLTNLITDLVCALVDPTIRL